MGILLDDKEIEKLTKPGAYETYFSHYPHIVARAQLKRAFEQLDEIIYYRHDAPHKTTIDWNKYQAFKKEAGIE